MARFHERDVVAIARAAGDAIMAVLADPATLRVERKGDDSPVTAADERAHRLIMQKLQALTPDIPILSEEMSAEEHAAVMKQGTYWCVDPLDGTRTAIQYAAGRKENTGFGVLIGLVKDGVPVFGVAHYPAQGPVQQGAPTGVTYFSNTACNEAFMQVGSGRAQRIRAASGSGLDIAPLRVAAGYRGVPPKTMAGLPAEHRPTVGGGRILAAASGQVDVGYMGNDGAISFGFWDLAAPQAILRAAGGELVTLPGGFEEHQLPGALAQSEPLRYDGRHFALGKQGQPYLPGCLAAHRFLLQHLGMPPQALKGARER